MPNAWRAEPPKAPFSVDTAEYVSAMITRFLEEKDFEAYACQAENYPLRPPYEPIENSRRKQARHISIPSFQGRKTTNDPLDSKPPYISPHSRLNRNY